MNTEFPIPPLTGAYKKDAPIVEVHFNRLYEKIDSFEDEFRIFREKLFYILDEHTKMLRDLDDDRHLEPV